MGVAGSGKSVQSKLLAEQLQYPRLSTGEFLRDHIGSEKQQEMLDGHLLSDQEIIDILGKVLNNLPNNSECILDGFPRTKAQAQWLLTQQAEGKLQLTAVIHILAKQKVVHDRLIDRGRPDDHEVAIVQRFREYEEAILPILEEFSRVHVPVYRIDGERPINAINRDILKFFKS